MRFYHLILYTHITCAALSIFLFTLRGIWMMRESNLLQLRVVRILPHIIDTVLLLAAIALTILINQFPLVTHWLTVKLIALIIYICLGMVALRLGKTKNQRVIAFFLALAVFGFIVSVAYYHHPLGILIVIT